MGSINRIYKPENWIIAKEGKSKILPDDDIYQMVIGWCDDELSSGELTTLISKDNYNNILNGSYTVFNNPYSEHKIIILDSDNNVIPLVKGKAPVMTLKNK